MTYKQIVDNIKDIVDRHHMLADFGYGQISDIKTGGDDGEANYPYAFLNPQTHTRSERSINYRFNLIVMDMYIGDDFLTAQSQCQEYIDDILADMKYAVQEYDVVINVTLTPFKERFQDVVGGMTATIELELPQKLNLCIAPIEEELEYGLIAEWNYTGEARAVNPDTGAQFIYNTSVLDDGNWNGSTSYSLTANKVYKFEVTQQITFDLPTGLQTLPTTMSLENRVTPIPGNQDVLPTTITGWPTEVTDPNQVYTIVSTWEDYSTPYDSSVAVNTLFDIPLQNESSVVQTENSGTIKIYEA